MSLPATIKSIQDIMRKDAGVDGDAQRIGQLGWMLFFKIFSDLEAETELEDDSYESPVPPNLQWDAWANEDTLGAATPTGDDLLDLIDNSLFPSLKDLDVAQFTGQARQRAELLRAVFEDAYNYMKSGTLMRQVINRINHDIDFNESKTRHTFGDIYEQILRDLQSAGNAGEFYTPRAATRFAVDMIDPKFGEVVLDPACGTGGFLTCAYEVMRLQAETPADLTMLKSSIRGIEKKSLPHLLCVTNLMVHGIEVPTGARHSNTLARPLRDYGPKDQVDVIITNPPFGGMEEDGIENNFPTEFRTRETADLFLVLVMELLKDGGRAAIILPDGTLFGEGIKTRIKRRLLEECNLHTIVRLPNGVFSPYTPIKTNMLFFTKGEATKEVWFYEHPYPDGYKSYSKTKPLRIEEFDAEKDWWTNRHETDRAWKVTAGEIAARGYNLDIANPNIADHIHANADVLLTQYAEATAEVEAARTILQVNLAPAVGSQSLLEHFAIVTDAYEGIQRLRNLVLNLGVQGRLALQEANDVPASMILEECRERKRALTEDGTVRTRSSLPEISAEEVPYSIPSGWVLARLDDWCDIAGGVAKGRRLAGQELITLPYLRVANVKAGYLVLDEIKMIDVAVDEVDKYSLSAGDVLLTEGGDWDKLGRSAIWTGEIEPCLHQNHVFRARTLSEELLPEWVSLFTNSEAGRKYFQSKAKRTTNLASINMTELRSTPLPVPPVAEQRRILSRLAEIEKLLTRLDSALKNARSQAIQIADILTRAG